MLINKSPFKGMIKSRDKNTNKYDYGHVLVLSGSMGMTGAPILVCESILRSGGGLVTCLVPKSVYEVIASNLIETMVKPMYSTSVGSLSISNFEFIKDFIKQRKINFIVLGPGLSRNEETMELVRKIVQEIDLPMLLDADGLFAFQGCKEKLKRKNITIITPHQNELSRLIDADINKIKKNREFYCKKTARDLKVICVLKGYNSVISDGKKVLINPTGNPGMAKAGSGDVLAGIISGIFCSQKKEKDVLKKIAFGVFVHGAAGDYARETCSETSMIATDIIDSLPRVFLEI
jgi:ADP-dependent NAD(P)H-hydrate dehydratase / NAD(P)H-hydrate epimerase